MPEKLKPCPFCGGEDIIMCREETFIRGYYCRCKSCGCRTMHFSKEEYVLTTWNRRAESDL